MKAVFDTSVLVAAMQARHAQHAWSRTWLARTSRDVQMHISAHTIAELYAVLTGVPGQQRAPAALAPRLIRENVLDKVQSVISITPSDYRTIIADLGDRGLLGGIVYDALIAFAAQKIDANAIVTLNGGDFRRLPWPVAQKVIEPS